MISLNIEILEIMGGDIEASKKVKLFVGDDTNKLRGFKIAYQQPCGIENKIERVDHAISIYDAAINL